MRHAYLFIYSDLMGTRKEVRDFLDNCPDVIHWRHDLPNTFYLVSMLSADELYDTIQSFNQRRGGFLVCEVGENTQGWLPKKTWRLLNKKTFKKRAPEKIVTTGSN